MAKNKIGFIAGNFDVIHPGYIYMFDEMLEHCDSVWVLLHTDPTIERPEKCKPILSADERIDVLSALHHVDAVLPYTLESELYGILQQFEEYNNDEKWDSEYVRFLGSDYIDKRYTGIDLDIPVFYLNRDHGWSTTKFKTLIADSLKK